MGLLIVNLVCSCFIESYSSFSLVTIVYVTKSNKLIVFYLFQPLLLTNLLPYLVSKLGFLKYWIFPSIGCYRPFTASSKCDYPRDDNMNLYIIKSNMLSMKKMISTWTLNVSTHNYFTFSQKTQWPSNTLPPFLLIMINLLLWLSIYIQHILLMFHAGHYLSFFK